MDKPFTLKIEELKDEIINNINKAELPAYCIKKILEEIYEEIERIDKKEIEEHYKELKGEK